jgi:hypothetical protein
VGNGEGPLRVELGWDNSDVGCSDAGVQVPVPDGDDKRGKKKAIVAVGRSILVIIWHLLSDPGAGYSDLGPGVYDSRISNSRKMRSHVSQLEALGYKVTFEPAA